MTKTEITETKALILRSNDACVHAVEFDDAWTCYVYRQTVADVGGPEYGPKLIVEYEYIGELCTMTQPKDADALLEEALMEQAADAYYQHLMQGQNDPEPDHFAVEKGRDC